MNICVILCAAGGSTRFNEGVGLGAIGGRSKLDEDLGGRPVLHRAIELFATAEAKADLGGAEIGSILVAGPYDEEAFGDFSLRHGDRAQLLGARLVRGGRDHRYETVAAALAEVPDEATHVAVHDAARPITPPALIERVVRAGRNHAAVIPGVEVSDTVKRVGIEAVAGASEADPLAAILGADTKAADLKAVEETISRERLVLVQTPQLFEKELLKRAYAQGDLASTDDAGLIERLGERVVVVEGDAQNIKITRAADVPVVRALGGFKPPSERPSHKKF